MVIKINVSMPEEILQEINKAAKEASTTRSAFLVKAAKRYLEEKEDARKRQKRYKAVETIHAVAEKLGHWDAVGEMLKSRNSH